MRGRGRAVGLRRWITTVGLAGCLFALLSGAALAQSGESVNGTIRLSDEDRTPVQGAEITVVTAGGEEVGTAVTGADGSFELELPGPGDYTASIDESTVGQAELRNPDNATLEFSVGPGASRILLFPLGESAGGGSELFSRFLQLVVEGVKFGLIIAITSVGLSLIFGTTGLVNFAHGEFVTFGALIAYLFNVTLGLRLIPAAALAVIVGAGFGALNELGLWRPLRRRGTGLIAMLVVSIGLSLFLRYLYLYQFGGRVRPYAEYAIQRAVQLGPVQIAPKDMWAIALSVLVLIGYGLVLNRTRIGKAMRAVSDNRDLAESSGIDVQRVVLFVWAMGGALAAFGGVLFGLGERVGWQMGFQLLLLMFAAIILGGLGTAYGPLLGGLVVGIFLQTSTLVISTELKNVGAFLVLILVLLFRPQGILGQTERVG